VEERRRRRKIEIADALKVGYREKPATHPEGNTNEKKRTAKKESWEYDKHGKSDGEGID